MDLLRDEVINDWFSLAGWPSPGPGASCGHAHGMSRKHLADLSGQLIRQHRSS
jgi:hypothetical protein